MSDNKPTTPAAKPAPASCTLTTCDAVGASIVLAGASGALAAWASLLAINIVTSRSTGRILILGAGFGVTMFVGGACWDLGTALVSPVLDKLSRRPPSS